MSFKDKDIDFFIDVCDVNGVACSTVSDGHVLMFKREQLQSLLDKYVDKPKIIMFIERPEFKD